MARVSQISLLRLDAKTEEDPEIADLWLMLLAGDPEATWHAWPGPARRPQFEDKSHS
jgi:hypothetical protein